MVINSERENACPEIRSCKRHGDIDSRMLDSDVELELFLLGYVVMFRSGLRVDFENY